MLIMQAEPLFTEDPNDGTVTASETMDNLIMDDALIDWLLPLEPEEARQPE